LSQTSFEPILTHPPGTLIATTVSVFFCNAFGYSRNQCAARRRSHLWSR